ncbi:MAG: MATE family efflux transporter, partial [Acidimicrobiia bacterium]
MHSEFDRPIAALAVPAFGSLVAEPLYVLADTAVVGRIGTTELAGLALASTVLLTAHALLIFLAYGATGPIARMISEGNVGRAAARGVQGMWLAAILGIVIAAVLAILAEPLLRLLQAEGEVLDAALLYLRVSLPGFPFLLLALAGAGVLHGRQDTRRPLVIAIGSALANLVIELVLVFGLGFGLGASALSTVIAQVGAGVAYIFLVVKWARENNASTVPRKAPM